MEVVSVLRVLLAVVLLLGSAERSVSDSVRCFARFDLGQCDEELGDVDEDDCCQNPRYGYQAADGECRSCGPLVWTTWSPWSPCNVLCGEGVTQRSRTCYGIGQSGCGNVTDRLETKHCDGSCCDTPGWGLWTSWSPCSVSCGGGGVRKRERVCASPPLCQLACSGPSEETETCSLSNTCPVHGGWSRWSDWTPCSGSCINDQHGEVPFRSRQRSCSSPAPSTDTVPPGNSCPGDDMEVQDCSELPNCPVDGGWGEWSPPGPCSVPCGEGLKLSTRRCDSPAPKYGGRLCDGPSTRSTECRSPCPVNGFWTGWSGWSECSSTCIPQSRTPVRTRQRSCTNPAPSSSPAGKACQGDDKQLESCNRLPHCPVDGGWGSWSSFSSCSITCGVGLRVSTRKCDSPAPKHGGRPCPGESRQTSLCETRVHCPVDGTWSDWSPWGQCRYPFGNKPINCQQIGGIQGRDRQCVHRAHNGSICSGDVLSERQVCYDVDRCRMIGSWQGWMPWGLCDPPCGENSERVRVKECRPDYSKYRPTIGRHKDKANFAGTPNVKCRPATDGEPTEEKLPCVNVPPCN